MPTGWALPAERSSWDWWTLQHQAHFRASWSDELHLNENLMRLWWRQDARNHAFNLSLRAHHRIEPQTLIAVCSHPLVLEAPVGCASPITTFSPSLTWCFDLDKSLADWHYLATCLLHAQVVSNPNMYHHVILVWTVQWFEWRMQSVADMGEKAMACPLQLWTQMDRSYFMIVSIKTNWCSSSSYKCAFWLHYFALK